MTYCPDGCGGNGKKTFKPRPRPKSSSIPPLLAETESSSPEYPNTSPESCTSYAWTVGGPCLCPCLVYADERYPSTMSYLTAEGAWLTSPQSPVVQQVWDSHCASKAPVLRHQQSWSLLRAAAKLVYSCPVAAYL